VDEERVRERCRERVLLGGRRVGRGHWRSELRFKPSSYRRFRALGRSSKECRANCSTTRTTPLSRLLPLPSPPRRIAPPSAEILLAKTKWPLSSILDGMTPRPDRTGTGTAHPTFLPRYIAGRTHPTRPRRCGMRPRPTEGDTMSARMSPSSRRGRRGLRRIPATVSAHRSIVGWAGVDMPRNGVEAGRWAIGRRIGMGRWGH